MVVFVTAIFCENCKYYSQVFLGEYLFKLYRTTQNRSMLGRSMKKQQTFA